MSPIIYVPTFYYVKMSTKKGDASAALTSTTSELIIPSPNVGNLPNITYKGFLKATDVVNIFTSILFRTEV